MKTRVNEVEVSFKALAVFSTLRSNLAMVDAFSRSSRLETSNYNGSNLGFLGVEPGKGQMNTHNRAVTIIQVALLYHTLENYIDIKRINPRLEDPDLEDFLNGFQSRKQFVGGMKTIRKGVFHVQSFRIWHSRKVVSFEEICSQRGGLDSVMEKLRKLLYDFTAKIFLGELKIWPPYIYEDRKLMERERPDFVEKLERGEVDFSEYLQVMNAIKQSM